MLPLALVLLTAPAQAGARITVSDSAHVDITGFIQPNLAVGISDDPSMDFTIRRARLFAKGRVSKRTSFFLGTLTSNLGKGGDYGPNLKVADAWVAYELAEGLTLYSGLFKAPFTRHGMGSGRKLHGIDFHSSLLRRSGNHASSRDGGVMLRGLVLGDHLDFRVALTDGVSTLPGVDGEGQAMDVPSLDTPRLTGRIGLNAKDAEDTTYFPGIWLGRRQVISAGVSLDLEPGVAGADGESLYWAVGADAFLDLPLGENELVATVMGVAYGPGGAMPEGMGGWADVGYRVGKVEPMVAAELYEPAQGDPGARLGVMGGVNLWLQTSDEWCTGYCSNLKLEVGATSEDHSGDYAVAARVQTQLGF